MASLKSRTISFGTRTLPPTARRALLAAVLLLLLPWQLVALDEEKGLTTQYVRDPSVWRTPQFRPQGFQFEIQISSLGTSYEAGRVRESIRSHNLGEWQSVVAPTIAAEWGYSFTHLNGQVDGAGRKIESGYPVPPKSREECLPVIEAFLNRQYIRGANHPWASMNGHFPWHHYAAEFGFDQLGSEIGENINSYQWHIALTRGAARQYSRPWFMDFSAWHGPSITDYSPGKIWGEYSGPDHGHSMSLFERSLFLCYMAGAGQITAEAGGAIAFLPVPDEKDRYRLSPYGEVCQRFRNFSLTHSDVGFALTPFAIVLDYYHGAYPGFGKRRAFWHFDYNAGDNMTWDLINLIWPGGWEVMGKEEVGTIVNGPFGDTFDILLQNASLPVLNSYPCLILSGDIRLSPQEADRYGSYVRQGGTLILNSAYLKYFPKYAKNSDGGMAKDLTDGKGRVIIFGPDFKVEALTSILHQELARYLPVKVSPGVQYLVNWKPGSIYVTLINNEGVTKGPRTKPVVDESKTASVSVVYQGKSGIRGMKVIENSHSTVSRRDDGVSVTIPPGEVVIVEFAIN